MLLLRNQQQFNAIFEEHWEILYQSAYCRIKDQEVVEDMLQDIFIDLWCRRESIIIHSTLKAYLLTAVKYRVIKYLDQKSKFFMQDIVGLEIANPEDEAVHSLEVLYGQLEVVLEKLPEKNRIVFQMSKLEGLTTQEIAVKLNIAPQTVHNHLTKSMKVIKAELSHLTPLMLLALLH